MGYFLAVLAILFVVELGDFVVELNELNESIEELNKLKKDMIEPMGKMQERLDERKGH